jgi:hypothetical protein
MEGLTYQGRRIARWHESMTHGELCVTLIVVDPRHPSGQRVVVLAGKDAAALKLSLQSEIEALKPFKKE